MQWPLKDTARTATAVSPDESTFCAMSARTQVKSRLFAPYVARDIVASKQTPRSTEQPSSRGTETRLHGTPEIMTTAVMKLTAACPKHEACSLRRL